MYRRLLVVSGLVAAASAFAPAGPAPGLRRATAARATSSGRPALSKLNMKAWDPAVDKDFLIAPSILSADFAKLGQEVDNMLAAGADVVHFDVMDNHYVPLMVSPVDRIVGDFIDAGASYITFHPEATNHIDRSLAMIRQGGCKAGLVFNPSTSLDVCKYVMDKLDIILLMSVNPGFGGQKFIPATLDKAREARKLIDESGYDISLEIDGGVSADNIKEIAEAGVDMFVAGSAIFGSDDYKTTIDKMREQLA